MEMIEILSPHNTSLTWNWLTLKSRQAWLLHMMPMYSFLYSKNSEICFSHVKVLYILKIQTISRKTIIYAFNLPLKLLNL